MKKLLAVCALVCVLSPFALAGPPESGGIEPPPPCETCAEGSTAVLSGVVWLFTNGAWKLFM